MNKIALIFLILIVTACGSGSTDKNDTQVSNDLPNIPMRLTNGSFRQLNALDGKSMLVVFQPSCDHCQQAAASMSTTLDSFSDYQIYFISSAPPSQLQQFAGAYGLSDAPNIYFGSTDVNNIIEKFGSIPTPSFYIYSENGTLQKEFIGETPMKDILGAL